LYRLAYCILKKPGLRRGFSCIFLWNAALFKVKKVLHSFSTGELRFRRHLAGAAAVERCGLQPSLQLAAGRRAAAAAAKGYFFTDIFR
jgi:hypothetical protein